MSKQQDSTKKKPPAKVVPQIPPPGVPLIENPDGHPFVFTAEDGTVTELFDPSAMTENQRLAFDREQARAQERTVIQEEMRRQYKPPGPTPWPGSIERLALDIVKRFKADTDTGKYQVKKLFDVEGPLYTIDGKRVTGEQLYKAYRRS